MLAKKCSYTLQDGEHRHANIVVNPEGTIDIDVVENKQHVTSELERVHFKDSCEGVQLICEDDQGAAHKEICLMLSRRDALELCEVIDNTIEEYEQLMSDL